jgi:SAM-dependent methyltransferase
VDGIERSTELNRAHWNELADVHGRGISEYYDVDRLIGGGSTLSRIESDGVDRAVGDLAGKDVLHLQCHLGMDAVSLARLGARVTGADFSPAALARAGEIASRCGVQVDFVEADATDLPAALHDNFDLVYATIGVLNWISDVDAWMRSVRSVLRPGGRLLLVDVHPLFAMFRDLQPLEADFPYASAGPVSFDEQGSYADKDAVLSSSATVEFAHSLGEVVTAAVGARLHIEYLQEHLECDFDPRGILEADADGLFRMRLGGRPAPVLYSIVASRT